MKTCFIHIGTHKTATTSIQKVLAKKRRLLIKSSVYLPKTGTLVFAPLRFVIAKGGHHNIAWNLLGDPRFTNLLGSVEELIAELENSTYKVAVISSEDFETLADRPDILKDFVLRLQQRGYNVKLILYLRNQIEYMESVYVEALKHGYKEDIDTFFHGVVKHGRHLARTGALYFDYQRLLKQLYKIPAQEIICRSYDETKKKTSIICDFLTIVAGSNTSQKFAYDLRLLESKKNIRIGNLCAEALLAFNQYDNKKSSSKKFLNFKRRLLLFKLKRIKPNDAAFSGLTIEQKIRLADKFSSSNQWVEKKYNIKIENENEKLIGDSVEKSIRTISASERSYCQNLVLKIHSMSFHKLFAELAYEIFRAS